MPQNNAETERIYRDIRHHITKRYDKRKEFAMHAAAYVLSLLFFWAIALAFELPAQGEFWQGVTIIGALATAGWTIGIVVHFFDYWFSEQREKAIERELRAVEILGGDKRKNERLVRLDAEGELVDAEPFDEDNDEAVRQARR
jgi:hypothetical protein